MGFFQKGLEAFDPEPGRYDAIWVQWAMLYLTDGAFGTGHMELQSTIDSGPISS